ncbi:putative dihydrodipicolinate synthase [Actinacidiphila reveromycinica]|uniref:Putative dihydrodipicolinate synthase n=1 Tax=Actinacidiphila reveromycinica TaxID=659352 RepID=A0A7U3VPW4_9ACTN|nr:dihydrodipicolinate synthase family protein [Streptomyces sp. SN-593]BBA99192.1 putative dihydrodipicolinate synthase [Streptomyces sp. SN-593]
MIHVPLITPFAPDGRVEPAALERLGHGLLDAGAGGLVALGTTAEAAALESEERVSVTTVVGRVCRAHGARFTVGVGGAGSTRRAAREAAALADLPDVPDAVLATVPSFTRPGESGVLAHFREVAAASPVPVLVYHVPHRTAQPLSAAALAALAAIPGVVGVKYATGEITPETVALLASAPPDFEVLAGDDVVAPALLALGAHGAVLAAAHLATGEWAALAGAGPDGAAEPERGRRLAALAAAVFREPNPAVVKAVLHAQGRIPTPDVRLPLLPASPGALAAALEALAAVADGEAAPAAGAAAGPGRLAP